MSNVCQGRYSEEIKGVGLMHNEAGKQLLVFHADGSHRLKHVRKVETKCAVIKCWFLSAPLVPRVGPLKPNVFTTLSSSLITVD